MVQVVFLNVSLIDFLVVRIGEIGAETRRRRRTGIGGEQGDLSGVSSGFYFYVIEVYLQGFIFSGGYQFYVIEVYVQGFIFSSGFQFYVIEVYLQGFIFSGGFQFYVIEVYVYGFV